MISIDEIKLDTNEEWLVRNALMCYREQCKRIARTEREAAVIESPYQAMHERLAEEWDTTTKRVEALEEKLG